MVSEKAFVSMFILLLVHLHGLSTATRPVQREAHDIWRNDIGRTGGPITKRRFFKSLYDYAGRYYYDGITMLRYCYGTVVDAIMLLFDYADRHDCNTIMLLLLL